MRRDISSLTFIYDYINNNIHCPMVQEEIPLAVPISALRPRAERGFFAVNTKHKVTHLSSTVPRNQALFNKYSENLDLAMTRGSYVGAAERLLRHTEDQIDQP
uniref:Uncharacterized protein n=1 Tax=Cacopsylla melanoneura TaxID=428564 RepID=A0A8D8YVP6_9HEMI